MRQLIYADNAATTRLCDKAFDAMIPWLTNEYGNISQSYSFARKPKRAIAEARRIIAECINAEPEEIFFTSGGTEGDNWAIKGVGNNGDKKIVIASSIEHHAILNACHSIAEYSMIKYLNVDSTGCVNKEEIQEILSADEVIDGCYDCKLVSVMLSNNEIGTIQPIKQLCRVAHEYGALFHTDAVQSMGHIPIDVKDMNVDMLSASAHKFNGPKGIGFMYIKKGTPINPLHNGGSQEFGMRAGTENVASIVGMAEALKNNCDSMHKSQQYLLELENALISVLDNSSIDYCRNGCHNHVPGNMSLSFKGESGEILMHRLDLLGICVSTGSACDNQNTQISHVLKAIKLEEEYAFGTIRISLSKDNTLEEIYTIGDALKRIINNK